MTASQDPATLEDIDEGELSGESGDIYLFQWLSALEKKLPLISMDQLKTKQTDLEKTLIKIISAPDPYPSPGRALRRPVARCLIALYTRIETRTLFDTIQVFLKIVGEFKAVVKDAVKIAAFSCIGDLMAVYGNQFMSFVAEIATVSLRVAKSSNSITLRYHALLALRKTLETAKRAVTDQLNKDILKQMKYLLTDKNLPLQRISAEVIMTLHTEPDAFVATAAEVESILGLCVKSLENADQVTRHSLAQLVGHLLASTQIERVVTVPAAAQKAKEPAHKEEGLSSPVHAASEIRKALFSPNEMLSHLSAYFIKPNASRKVRIGIIDFYAALFNHLGASFIEVNYALIVNHLLTDITMCQKSGSSRYETVLTRTLVGILLRDLIGVRMLSEQGQIGAIQELASSYLRRWPAMMPGQVAPDSKILVIVLREVAGLLQQLGNAPPPVQDALSDPLVALLAHPSHSTRVTAAYVLRCFCYSTPLRLPKTILTVIELLQRDLSSIVTPTAPSDISTRTLGHAYGLAALVSVIPERPLYVSYDVSAKVLDMATQLLKRAGEHDVKVAHVEVDVAWTLIASLMSLGPNFVRPHLPQLLVLWRNALPKPTSKDSMNNAGRTIAEWAFLLSVRESALGAILCFLQHNISTLVTLDVARRIASVLSNALTFANNFVSQPIEDPAELQVAPTTAAGHPIVTPGLTLRQREALLRRRVYQCFTALGFSSITEPTQLTLLQSVVSLFASPDGYVGSSMQAQIASSSGTVTNVWQSTDGYAYGVTMAHEVVDIVGGIGGAEIFDSGSRVNSDYLHRDEVEVAIDNLLRSPILRGYENDPLCLCRATRSSNSGNRDILSLATETPPPATAVVDTSIDLFARLLPLQDLYATIKIIQQLLEAVKSPKLEKNTGRKAVVGINTAIAIVLMLRNAMGKQSKAKETLGSVQITGLLSPFLKDVLVDGDTILRSASAESIGRLASLSDTNFLTGQIKHLVDQVVSNRDPNCRAGCALAFGAIYTHVGGLAAGPLLKTTVNVLMSLSNDPHPIVHFWALNALARVINAASLAYAPFVSSTLGMLVKIYVMESHEREGGVGTHNVNLSGEFPAYPVVCQIIDAVTNVLGPDLQESGRTRAMVLSLIREFLREDDEGEKNEAIVVEAITCIQHFLMYAPEYVDVPQLVRRFRGYLMAGRGPGAAAAGGARKALKVAAINALYQLVQKDALAMSKLGGDQLVEDLFGMLDEDNDGDHFLQSANERSDGAGGMAGGSGGSASSRGSAVEGVRNVIQSWLQQTVVYNPSAWIDLCQRIMAKTTASQQVADAAASGQQRTGPTQKGGSGGNGTGLMEDEGDSLGAGSRGGLSASISGGFMGSTSRWRTQLFALQCLNRICRTIASSGLREHFDVVYARKLKGITNAHAISGKQDKTAAALMNGLLFARVPDLIRMAFTASTAYVTEIRLEGLVLLRDVIEIFATSPDPAYDDALLLEQHQAPITAALTPAFSADSTPEILASAVHACAVFVGCGVVKDVSRMGRILKLLTVALDQCKDSRMVSLGETGELSPNASAMLRISTLSAWAQLEISSAQQQYLVAVLKPYRGTLASLWVASLRDYASIKIDSEFLLDSSSVALDSSYSSLGKEVLLPYYASAWSVILKAVGKAMEHNDPYVLAAMDGHDTINATSPPAIKVSKDRVEPAQFFYIVFGIVYEALATSSTDSSSGSSSVPTRLSIVDAALQTLRSLVRPEYAGNALKEATIFDEFISLCYRLAMTEPASVQVKLISMLTALALSGSKTEKDGVGLENADPLPMNSPKTHCLRICSSVLKHSTSASRGPIIQGSTAERVAMTTAALSAYVTIANTIHTIHREEVRGIAILLYNDLLKDESSEIDLVGPTLPSLKNILDIPFSSARDSRDRYERVVHGLLSACLTNIDQMREGLISTKKIKNNLLAAVLILTVIPPNIKVGQPVVEHCCFLISQKLLESDEISLTAVHCAKTLVVAATTGSPILQQCTKLLLPGLIEYIAKMAPYVHDNSLTEAQSTGVNEVWKAFSALFTSVPEDKRARLLGVLLPTISLLLSPQTTAVAGQIVAQLLSYATASPVAFKEAAAKLEAPTRELLENSIRKAVGSQTSAATQQAAKPQISLRSF